MSHSQWKQRLDQIHCNSGFEANRYQIEEDCQQRKISADRFQQNEQNQQQDESADQQQQLGGDMERHRGSIALILAAVAVASPDTISLPRTNASPQRPRIIMTRYAARRLLRKFAAMFPAKIACPRPLLGGTYENRVSRVPLIPLSYS
jgi:hypothetical protein